MKISPFVRKGIVGSAFILVLISYALFIHFHNLKIADSNPVLVLEMPSLKAPYSINESKIMVEGWVRPNQTGCKNMQALSSSSTDSNINFYPSTHQATVKSDGTFSIELPKNQNSEIVLTNATQLSPGVVPICLAALYIPSSSNPLIVDADSSAVVNLFNSSFPKVTENDVSNAKLSPSYPAFEHYMSENLISNLLFNNYESSSPFEASDTSPYIALYYAVKNSSQIQ